MYKRIKSRPLIFGVILLISISIIFSACSSSPTTTTPAAPTTPATQTTTPGPATSNPPTTTVQPSPTKSPTPPPPASTPPPISTSATPAPTTTTAPSPSASPATFTVNISNKAGIGGYLVDGKGMTLYYFAKDVNGKSNASGSVLQTWPLFSINTVTVPSTLSAGDFAPITRTDSLSQTSYKGWPLYYFANDKAPGDTLGDGIGGVWFLVKVPFYTAMLESRTDFGNFLVDAKGMTLYYFTKDSPGVSTASASVLAVWPIFNAANFVLPSGLNAADFATITRSDGQQQTTYKGYPLYHYVNDKISGDAAGNGVNAVWFVISVAKFPPPPTTTPPPAGGGGY